MLDQIDRPSPRGKDGMVTDNFMLAAINTIADPLNTPGDPIEQQPGHVRSFDNDTSARLDLAAQLAN